MIIVRPCRSQYGTRSGTRAIVPSSFVISQITPDGFRPASRARSTAASVWPIRSRTPPGSSTQPLHVAAHQQVGRPRVGRDRDLDRVAAVGGGDAGGDALARVDRRGVGGAVPRAALVGDQPQPELVGPRLGQAEADLPAGVGHHEVERLGRRELSRDGEVALVLAVGIVDHDDEAALADLLDRLLDRGEWGRHCHGSRLARSDKALDVLGEHVRLEVHRIAGLELAERGRGERVRDQRDLEAGVVEP